MTKYKIKKVSGHKLQFNVNLGSGDDRSMKGMIMDGDIIELEPITEFEPHAPTLEEKEDIRESSKRVVKWGEHE